MIVHIVAVFHEVGGEDDYLVSGVEDGLQGHVDGRGCAAGHQDVPGAEGKAGLRRQIVGNGLAGLDIAVIGHVPVHPLDRAIGQAANLPVELFRGFDHRIAQRQVKYILFSILGLQGDPRLEHLADPAALFHEPAHFIRDRHLPLLG